MKDAREMVRSIRRVEWVSLIEENHYAVANAVEPEKSIGSKKRQERKELKLEEGEVICVKCDGEGNIYNSRSDFLALDTICPKCNGEGKVDWVTNAIERPRKDYEHYMQYLVEEMAKKTDREIRELISGTFKKQNDTYDSMSYNFKSILKGGSES